MRTIAHAVDGPGEIGPTKKGETNAMAPELVKALKMGPDMFYRGQTVYIDGSPIGDFGKPWEVINKTRRALEAWGKRVIETEGRVTEIATAAKEESDPLTTPYLIPWKHFKESCPAGRGCSGKDDCVHFPTRPDRILHIKQAFDAYGGADGTELEDFIIDAALLAASTGAARVDFTVAPNHRAPDDDLVIVMRIPGRGDAVRENS